MEILRGPQWQNYFQNDAKKLIICPFHSHSRMSVYDLWYHNQLNAEVDMRTQLLPIVLNSKNLSIKIDSHSLFFGEYSNFFH